MSATGRSLLRLALPRRGPARPPRAAARRPRAARSLAWFAAGFVALQAAFHYPVAALFPQARDVEYGKKLVRLRRVAAERPPGRPLVVALGSSLTAMGFCPAALPGQDGREPGRPVCYNFAVNSCGVVVQHLCLRRLLAEGIRPDLVLVEFTPYFLHRPHNLVNDGELLPPLRLLPGDFAALGRYHPDAGRLHADWRGLQLLPWWSYRGNLQQWADPESVPKERRVARLWRHTDRWGWEALPEFLESFGPGYAFHLYPEVCRGLREWWHDITGEPPDPQMAAAYLDLAELCGREGIRAVFVRVPESSPLRDGCHPAGARRFEELALRVGAARGVEVVDARDWLADPLFVEGLHPTPDGAHAYTTRLDREVLRRVFPPAP